mgnify:CR=1 FL=1
MGFQQGLSGLSAASKQLDVIGNNIANGSTIGFKGSRVEFGDMYARSLASASTQAGTNTQAGVGVQVLAVSQQFQQGNITTTNNPLDMAISGNGFYRLTSENTGNGGIEAFSRNGEFKLDKEGYIVNNGYYLNGYQMVNGVKTGAEQPLPALPAGAPNDRLGFAQWLVSGEHPLTARVIAAKALQDLSWQQLAAGTGLSVAYVTAALLMASVTILTANWLIGATSLVVRNVSTTLRQSAKEFSEYSFLENPMRRVC